MPDIEREAHRKNMKPYEYLDHTADAAMRVTGDTLKTLFTHAAHGLFEMIAVTDTIDETTTIDIQLTAEAVDILFVEWLDTLIFRHETEELFFKRVDIQAISQTELSAVVYGEPTNFDKHVVYTEIKAVTYHQLSVKQTAKGAWEAQVIFDL